MLREILYLEGQRAGIPLVVHQQVQRRRGLKGSEIARPVSHRTVGDLEQHLERGPRFKAQGYDDRAEELDEMNRALNASSNIEEAPPGAPGHVFHFDPAHRRERADPAIQSRSRAAHPHIPPPTTPPAAT